MTPYEQYSLHALNLIVVGIGVLVQQNKPDADPKFIEQLTATFSQSALDFTKKYTEATQATRS